MAKQIINIGQTPNDNSGDPIRVSFNKINENFTELYKNLTINGPYIDDADASNNDVVLGGLYYNQSGQVHIRLV